MADDNATPQLESEKQTGIKRKVVPHSAWKPGQSGNPNGRPKKGTALTDIMREMFVENGAIPKAIVAKLLQMAAGGDIAAIREVLDRIEGKPMQATDITTDGDKINQTLVIYKPEKLKEE